MLTDDQASAAEPREKDYKLADANGLYLFVMRSGFKSWRMKYRFGGKERRLTFGPYPEVSLEEARARRDDARRLLRQQVDPGVVRQQLRTATAGAGSSRPNQEAMIDEGGTEQTAIDETQAGSAQRPVLNSEQELETRLTLCEPVRNKAYAIHPSEPVVEQVALGLLRKAETAAEAAARDAHKAWYAALLAFALLGATLIAWWW